MQRSSPALEQDYAGGAEQDVFLCVSLCSTVTTGGWVYAAMITLSYERQYIDLRPERHQGCLVKCSKCINGEPLKSETSVVFKTAVTHKLTLWKDSFR